MRRILKYLISLLIINLSFHISTYGQDTLIIPLKIKAGIEVTGPIIYYTDKNILNTEAYISADINEKYSLVLNAGYLDYKYSQYNYEYLSKGIFLKSGIDINLMKPIKSMGKYWAGIGLKYGLSRFTSETPTMQQTNYWGTETTSIGKKTSWGHFIEVSPGVRAEIFRNISIGWTISIRKLIYAGNGNDLKPIYFPGYGAGSKSVSTGINYFITFNIPYKKITVITKKEIIEVQEESTTIGTTQGSANGIR